MGATPTYVSSMSFSHPSDYIIPKEGSVWRSAGSGGFSGIGSDDLIGTEPHAVPGDGHPTTPFYSYNQSPSNLHHADTLGRQVDYSGLGVVIPSGCQAPT